MEDKKQKNTEYYIEMVKSDPETIWTIPKKFHTVAFSKIAIEAMGYKSLADAVKDNPEILSQVHVSLYDYESCRNFIDSDFFKKITRDKSRFRVSSNHNGVFYVSGSKNKTYSLSHMMRWRDIAEAFIRIDGFHIAFAKKGVLSEKLVELALELEPRAFGSLPDEVKSPQMCEWAVKIEPYYIRYVPQSLVTEDMVLSVVKRNGSALEYIPDEFKTKAICLIAINENEDFNFGLIPKEIVDKELCMVFFEKCNKGYFKFQDIPERIIDYDLCLTAIKYDGKNLESIPRELLSYDLCLSAVRNNGSCLKFVPENIITYEMCLEAVNEDSIAIRYVPRELITNELCMAVVKDSYLDFNNIPQEFLTEEVCLKAVSYWTIDGANWSLAHVPEELKTQEMCDIAVRNSFKSIKDVPEKYITEDMLLFVAEKDYGMIPSHFPERLRTREFLKRLYSVESALEFFYHFEPID